MKRRTFLKAAGAGVTAVGIEGILTAHRAPAFAQGTTLHILRWIDFIPAADEIWRKEYVPVVAKSLGIEGWSFADVEVTAARPPAVRLHGRIRRRARELGVSELRLSLTHARETAAAVALAQRGAAARDE